MQENAIKDLADEEKQAALNAAIGQYEEGVEDGAAAGEDGRELSELEETIASALNSDDFSWDNLGILSKTVANGLRELASQVIKIKENVDQYNMDVDVEAFNANIIQVSNDTRELFNRWRAINDQHKDRTGKPQTSEELNEIFNYIGAYTEWSELSQATVGVAINDLIAIYRVALRTDEDKENIARAAEKRERRAEKRLAENRHLH